MKKAKFALGILVILMLLLNILALRLRWNDIQTIASYKSTQRITEYAKDYAQQNNLKDQDLFQLYGGAPATNTGGTPASDTVSTDTTSVDMEGWE